MSFFVNKIEWEYGEKYGHIFYPQTLEEFRDKLQELDEQAIQDGHPFYVEIFFADDSYIGLIVGHALSCFYFGIFVSDRNTRENSRTRYDSHFDLRKEGDNTYIEYSFKGDHGEKSPVEMLPKEQVFMAIEQYIETQQFPSYILLGREEFIEKYIRLD